MSDLFATSPQIISLPGADCELRYYPNFLAASDADQLQLLLTEQVAWQQSNIRIAGKLIPIPRLNAWYGNADASYGYSGIQLPNNLWFKELKYLLDQVNDEINGKFNSALLNLYRDGKDSVAWHSDDEPELGISPLIASVSLGATRRFLLKQKQGRKRFSLELEHGALLVMAGATQHHWQHQIPKDQAVTEPRINITFRKILATK